MIVQELFDTVMALPHHPYDERMAAAQSPSQWEAYRQNQGHKYYNFLANIVRQLQPKKVLELGTSIGRSALFMMLNLPADGQLVTVDVGTHLRSDLSVFAQDARLKIVFGSDLDPAVFAQVGSGFDFVFLDSEHSYDQIVKEWALYKDVLADGAIVVLDDISLNDGMKKFWSELPFEKVDCGLDLHFSGFGMFRYAAPKPVIVEREIAPPEIGVLSIEEAKKRAEEEFEAILALHAQRIEQERVAKERIEKEQAEQAALLAAAKLEAESRGFWAWLKRIWKRIRSWGA